jgi:hypothetical protein
VVDVVDVNVNVVDDGCLVVVSGERRVADMNRSLYAVRECHSRRECEELERWMPISRSRCERMVK